ncbi:MAG: hypothetical protein JJ934_03295 [Pseudomonadales bacterium]|nr:hypothetical protein [Pseudomonadales bacterium]
MSSTFTLTYSRTHTAVFVSDSIRNVLRDIVIEGGLKPTRLVDSWGGNLGRAIRTWLESGDLISISLEFYMPGSDDAVARWDFPIKYDGSGADDDMWVSKRHIKNTIAKADKPPQGAVYRVIATHRPGAADVDGMVDAEFKSTTGLVCRSTGTAIATPDIMAGMKYWRTA